MKLYPASDSRYSNREIWHPRFDTIFRDETDETMYYLEIPVMYWDDILNGEYHDWVFITDELEELSYPRESLPDDYAEENAADFRSAVIGKISQYVRRDMLWHVQEDIQNNTNQAMVLGVLVWTEDTGQSTSVRYRLASPHYWGRNPHILSNDSDGNIRQISTKLSLAKDTGRFEYTRWLETERPYTKCKLCGHFNKYRTEMVPVYHQQRRWQNRKNICIKCLCSLIKGDTIGDVGYDGENQLIISDNPQTYSHLDYHNKDYLVTVTGEYGRAFRKIAEIEDEWHVNILNGIKLVETIDIPTWDYSFDTSIHAWNWRFPIFLTTPRTYGDHDNHFFESHSLGYDWQDPSWYGNTGPYFGAEFECFVRNDRQDLRANNEVKKTAIKMFHPTDYPTAYTQDAEHQLIYAKEDGSLNDGDGVEFVSQPLSYDYWMNHVPERFWDYFRNNFRARNSSQCGIHVHIGWESMDVVQRYIFLYFLNRMNLSSSELLQRVAGRGSTYYSVWNSLVYQGSRDQVFQVALEKTQTGDNPKYNSINTRHADTIELRYFQGNTGENSIKGIFQFINGLYRISDELANPHRDWDYTEEEQPEELKFLLQGIKEQTDSTFLRQLMNTERLTADDIKYFVNRVGIDWILTKLNDDEYVYMAEKYLDVPSI